MKDLLIAALAALAGYLAIEAWERGYQAALTDEVRDLLDHADNWCACKAQGLPSGVHRIASAEVRGD